MTYLAISRKYRPATFDEIVGQDHVTRTLRNAIQGDRIHHAYLFTGARGVGKTTAARALSRALNCETGPTDTPCGTCVSCREIASGTSPDLIEVDGASNNSVEDVREIRDSVAYAPSRGKFKIYLVDEVHMLSKGAFNALLKTLEEPPPHVVFVFATTEPNKIPDTILSRVQRFDFKRIPVPKVVERLNELATQEGVTIPAQGLRLIARAGEGSMRDAESLLDQVISAGVGQERIEVATVTETLGLVDRRLLIDFLGGLVRGEPAACFVVIEQVYGWGHELSTFADELLEVVRDATFLGLSPDAQRFVDLPEEEAQALLEVVSGADPERLARLFDALVEVQTQVKQASRPRIVLEMAVARLATVRKAQPVHALLGRLETLERGLRAQHARAPSAPAGAPPRRGARGGRDARGSGSGGRGGPSSREPSSRRSNHGEGLPVNARAQAPQRPLKKPPLELREPPPPIDAPHEPLAPAPPHRQEPPPPTEADLRFAPTDDHGWGNADLHKVPLTGIDLAPRRERKATGITRRVVTRTTQTGSTAVATDPKWSTFCDAMERAGGDFRVFTRASHIVDNDRVRLILSGGRTLAIASRLAEHPEVVKALAASYPGRRLALEASRSGRVDSAQLEREFLADPALKRIVQTLGATVERVVPYPDEE